MKAVNFIVDTVIRAIMAVSALALFITTFLQVVFRFILSMPLAWSQDIIRLCFAYLVFCGAAYCVREKAHLNIDVLLTSISQKARLVLELAINIVLLGFFVFIFYYGLQFAATGATQNAPYLPIPMSLYYCAVPISGALMFFYMIQQVVDQVLVLAGKKQGGEAR